MGIKLIRFLLVNKVPDYTTQQIFGINAIEDADTLTIAKTDLAQNSGLTPDDNDGGESLLAAIIVQAQALGLDTEHRDGTDETAGDITQQVAINPVVSNFVTRQDTDGNELWFKRDSYTIDFDLPLPVGVNPNNYKN